jgi:hypothetical protein
MLVGKHEEKRPFERPRCRWEDNIKVDFREIELEDFFIVYVTYCHLLKKDCSL